MSMFLILLAAGSSKRLKSDTPKPYCRVNNKTLLEHSINSFSHFKKIKKTIILYNKKHKKYIDKLKSKNTLKIVGGKTRLESTYIALKKIKKMNCKKVLIHDVARPNPSKKLISKIIDGIKNNHAVIPTIKVNDAAKRSEKNIISRKRTKRSGRNKKTQ